MKNIQRLIVLTALAGFAFPVTGAKAEFNRNWPQWRGPLATGVAPHAQPPLEWNESKNVKWKVALPGAGTGTPVIWGNQVFILTAIPTPKQDARPTTQAAATEASPPAVEAPREGQRRRGGGGGGFGRSQRPTNPYQFTLMCLDRATGKMLWQKTAIETVPHEGHHQDHGFASASAVTDGEHVLAYFGSRGLHCYDLKGNLKWSKEFGQMRTRNSFGEGASPALHGNTGVVNWDHEGDDFIVALDKRTGRELWRKPRNEPTSWSTPLIVEVAGKPQVIVNATTMSAGYDLATGEVIWQTTGNTENVIPSPVTANGIVYLLSGFRGNLIQAVRLGRSGNLAGTDAIVWSHNRSAPYVPSPLLVDGLLYFLSGNNATVSCFDAQTGTPHYEAERLTGVFGAYASPVAANGRVYVLGRDGKCAVLKQGPKLEVLTINQLDEKTDASIALVDKELFIRGHQSLYCIAEK